MRLWGSKETLALVLPKEIIWNGNGSGKLELENDNDIREKI